MNPFIQPRRETAIICKTLIVFLESLVGEQVKIELKDDSIVSGRLTLVDAFMNCTLSEASLSKPVKSLSGQYTKQGPFDSFFVKGTKIRYVNYDSLGDKRDKDEISSIERQLSSYQRRHQNMIASTRRLSKGKRKKEMPQRKE